ncbi:MAG: hypothetical protein Tsb002_07220 [Wenzhouxiangellaceae bacterium]
MTLHQQTGDRTQRGLGWILLLIFTASGFSGLIYQSIWSHYLGLYLGHAAYAQALVLAIFMGGMALGAWLVSRRSQGWGNLIRGYALVEAIIGLLALIFHGVFTASIDLAYEQVIPALNSPGLVYLWKWLSAALLILPQSILLGMTFPLLSGGYIRRQRQQDGRILSGLYFSNSIGAAMGALASTFLLMPAVGLPGTVAAAGWINLGVAAIAWLVAGRADHPARSGQDQTASTAAAASSLPTSARFVLFAAFITGASSFIYEIGWVRMLNLALGTTVHSFEIMLAAFIAGLAFGGLWIRRKIDSLERPLRAAAFAQLLMGLAVIMSLALYNSIFDWVSLLLDSLARSGSAYTLFNLGSAAIAIVIMMPAAFFAGMTLPLFTLALLRDGRGESSIGRIYATNTLGAIVGVFLAVHLLIPWLGLKNAMLVAAAADLLLGIALLRLYFRQPFKFDYPLAAALSAAAILFTLLVIDFDYQRITSGVFRHGVARLGEKEKLIHYQDGKTASVSVISSSHGTIRIATNGKTDGGARIIEDVPYTQDEPTMVLAAALPLAFTSAPRQAAVIGFGTGLSTHTLLADPSLTRVDTIEIEQAMVIGATAFGERNKRAYEDPRSIIHIEDAKSFFSSQQQRFDIILSEPSNPWVSGVGALFSKEFYAFVPRYLTDDGILVQWLQLYEISNELVASVLDSMLPNFEHVEAFLSNTGDMIMLARNGKALQQPARDIFRIPALRAELALIDFNNNEQLQFRRIADKAALRAFADMYNSRVNSDYFPVLSLNAPRTRYMGTSADLPRMLSEPDWPTLELLDIKQPLSINQAALHGFYYPADRHTTNARAMYRYLLENDASALAALPEKDANNLQSVQRNAQQCEFNSDPTTTGRFIEQLRQLAIITIPYLPTEQALQLWQQPQWLACASDDPRLTAALNLFAVMAARDGAALYESASNYLQASIGVRPPTNNMHEYALIAAYLGAAVDDDGAAIESLERDYGKRILLGRFGELYKRFLISYQRQQHAPGHD